MTSHTRKRLGPVEIEALIKAASPRTKELAKKLREDAPELLKAAIIEGKTQLIPITARFNVSMEEAYRAVSFNILVNRLGFYKRAARYAAASEINRSPSPTPALVLITLKNISSLQPGDTIMYNGGRPLNQPTKGKARNQIEHILDDAPYCGRHEDNRFCTCSPRQPNTIDIVLAKGSKTVIRVDVENKAAYWRQITSTP
ncbi:hypothetical protein GW930_01730 [Candidatus Saccharibacteria bacterium]|nr:hypothetical protein [Candidatus Saccharibacteria bacterium]